MTLLARRRDELRADRAPAEPTEKRRSVAMRPTQPRPSFFHLQSAVGNHAVDSSLRASALSPQRGDQPEVESRPRGADARDLVASELGPLLRLAGLLYEPPPAARGPRRLLVPEGAAAADGQMTRGAFLAAMRDAAGAAAERALAGSGHTARGCPWIEHYFRYYERQNAARIEADLRRYLPAARMAASADELLVVAAEHIGASVRHWAASGELVGVPRDLPGAGLVAAVQARLGGGRPLPASLRGRMERAFGRARFADVRLHTDAVAAGLARRLRTRAFAVGPHVAFDRGEYRPGTVVGDAVLAHELAHTLQQRGAEAAPRRAMASTRRVEDAADSAAAGVMARLWGDGRAFAQRLAARPVPRLRSGLALASCRESFSDDELRSYLQTLEERGAQKGIQDDNRARAVVRENGKRPGTFVPTDKQALGLVEDMLDGDTGEGDQNAILVVLDQSNAARLLFLFTNGLTSRRLRAKISGERRTQLQAFFLERFEGGAKALDAGDVQPIADEEFVEHSFAAAVRDASRGFRRQDLEKLGKEGKSLAFAGSLSPLPADLQQRLLDNIAATVSFALDPANPVRQAEVKAVQQEIAAGPKSDLTPFQDAEDPAKRVDATDLFHGHVCVPLPVFERNDRLKELQKKTFYFHGAGGHGGQIIEEDVAAAQGRAEIGTTEAPRTLGMARTVIAEVEKHRTQFLAELGPLLEALKTVPEAGVEYHSLEHNRPKIGITGLPGHHPIRNIFTPLATNQPQLLRVGHPHCEALINFSFHVNRGGEITLLPGAEANFVFAYELLHPYEGPPRAAPPKTPEPTAPPGGGR